MKRPAKPRQPPRMIVAGHICLDIQPVFPAGTAAGGVFRPGGLTLVGPALRSTGGAVSNTGLALHRLGVETRLLGKVGDDWIGREILAVLRSRGPRLAAGMIAVPGARSSYSIVLNPPGVDRGFLHDPGANDTFAAGDVPPAKLRGASLFHFGYPPVMRRLRRQGGREMARMLGGVRRRGLAVSLDMAGIDAASEAGRTDWVAWLGRVLPLVDFFLPSLDETVQMLEPVPGRLAGILLDGRGEGAAEIGPALHDLAERLLRLGPAAVMLKMGVRGVYLLTSADRSRWARLARIVPIDPEDWRDRELRTPSFKVQARGTTGAGDCAIAGFLAAVGRGLGPEEAAACAAGAGALCVESPAGVAGMPAWRVLRRRMRAGWARNEGQPPAGSRKEGGKP